MQYDPGTRVKHTSLDDTEGVYTGRMKSSGQNDLHPRFEVEWDDGDIYWEMLAYFEGVE